MLISWKPRANGGHGYANQQHFPSNPMQSTWMPSDSIEIQVRGVSNETNRIKIKIQMRFLCQVMHDEDSFIMSGILWRFFGDSYETLWKETEETHQVGSVHLTPKRG